MTSDELERLASLVREAMPSHCICSNGGVWAEVDPEGLPSIRFCAHHAADEQARNDQAYEPAYERIARLERWIERLRGHGRDLLNKAYPED